MIDVIARVFPDAECELKHDNPFELTIAVLLSAQCRYVLVNRRTTELFKKYKTPEDYLAVSDEELMNEFCFSLVCIVTKLRILRNFVNL